MMPGNSPILTYEYRHHWQWLLRRMSAPLLRLAIWSLIALSIFLLMVHVLRDNAILYPYFLLLPTLLLIVREIFYLAYIYLDWMSRKIRLYSDGRLEYICGILIKKGLSVQTRFGVIRYKYRNRINHWLDCADLELPFGAGQIEDIPRFRLFWELVHNRI